VGTFTLAALVALPEHGGSASLRATAPDPLTTLTVDTVRQISLLGGDAMRPGLLLARARQRLRSRAVRLLGRLDADGDGFLTFAEVLGGDVVGAASRAADGDDFDVDATTVDADVDELAALVRAHFQAAGDAIGLLPDEIVRPRVSLRGLHDDFGEVVDEIPRAALGRLSDQVADLDARPAPPGDMTDRDFDVNRQRRLGLMAQVETMYEQLDAGEATALIALLRQVRARADGSPRPPDFVTGPAAERMVKRIDEVLRFAPFEEGRR